MSRSPSPDFRRALTRSGNSITLILIGVMVLTFALGFLGLRAVYGLALEPEYLAARPWNLLLYPFGPNAGGLGLFWTLLSALWLYSFGSWVERDQGSVRFAWAWVIFTLLGGGCAVLAYAAHIGFVGLYGPLLPASAITVVWSARNPTATIMLWGLIPITGKILGWLVSVFVLVGTGQGAPLAGLLMCLPLLAAWAWAAERLPIAYSARRVAKKVQSKRDYAHVDDAMNRQKEREERERLRKLFESSIEEDEK